MKIRYAFCYFPLLTILATPLLSVAQQAPPPIQARPLYGSAAQAAAAPGQASPSSDPRLLQLAERFKTAFGQVRDANPAVVPAPPDKPSSVARLQQRATGPMAIRMRPNTGTPRFIEGARLESAATVLPAAAAANKTSPRHVIFFARTRSYFVSSIRTSS